MDSKVNGQQKIKWVARSYLTREMALRVLADAAMVSFSLLVAYTVRYIVIVNTGDTGAESARRTLDAYWHAYLRGVWLLILVSIVVFSLSGFYTYGRAYRGRFKALVIVQAVSISYLVFAAIHYFAPIIFAIPRSVLLGAYLLSIALLMAARLWSMAWKTLTAWELGRIPRPNNGKIRAVLLIGGAGYIGSTLLPKLLEGGYHVRLLDLFLYGKNSIADYIGHPSLEVVKGDFRDVETVVNVMQGMDAVVHLGAIVGDPACALNERLTIEVNLMATQMIAEVAKGSGVSRFVFASTCSVYGASDNLLDEHSVLKPVSLYARSKIASEQVLMQMADENFSPVILRFATIYGLSRRMRFDLVVNLLTAKAVREGSITLFGGGQWRPFVQVDDAAQAIVAVLKAGRVEVHNQIFNVGSDEQNYTLRHVGELIESLVPAAEVVELGSNDDHRNYRVNFAKIRNTLHYVPQWTMERGVRQIVEVIESGLVEDYQSPEYSNVKFLSQRGSDILLPYNGRAEAFFGEEYLTVSTNPVDGKAGIS